MNISQHVILPNKWKDGQCNFDGSLRGAIGKSMTHWFPISTSGHFLFYLEPDAETLYGFTLGRTPSMPVTSSYADLTQTILDDNYCIFDGVSVVKPSKPFTYILI